MRSRPRRDDQGISELCIRLLESELESWCPTGLPSRFVAPCEASTWPTLLAMHWRRGLNPASVQRPLSERLRRGWLRQIEGPRAEGSR